MTYRQEPPHIISTSKRMILKAHIINLIESFLHRELRLLVAMLQHFLTVINESALI